MSAILQRSLDAEAATLPPSDDLDSSAPIKTSNTLAALPVGARLILRCRKDWRVAAVAFISPEQVTLSVASPSGHTYRVRRPPNALLNFEGDIPVLGEGCWRIGLARYDARW